MNRLNILNLSSLALWDLGRGKGHLSKYLPMKGFIDKGHNVYYLTNNPIQKTENMDGIAIERIKTPLANKRPYVKLLTYPITLLSFLCKGIGYIIRYKINVIYAHTSDTALPAFLLSKIFRTKYILRLYGVSYQKTKRFKVSYLFLYLSLWLKADLYLLTNDGTAADKVALSFGVPSDKIRFLKNGINKEWGISCYDETLKKEIAPNKEFVLLSVSRLVNWKQVDLIIKALPDLIRLNNNIKLIIVGDGPDRVKLEKLCIQLQISEYVIFTGALPQKTIKDYMAISDIFISMNALSSLSNPVFEAMICGKTAIALNRGTTKELIRNEENGILVEEEQIDELPLIMNNILQNDIMRKRIGDSAKKYMLEQWPTWEERVSQEISIIESLF